MRLIDAPIGIFRFDSELVLKTEYYSEDKQSGKYIPDCYIIRTGEYFWGGTKTANELINLDIEPVDFAELLPTVTDTISRQAAIIQLSHNKNKGDDEWELAVENDIQTIWELPPAQPKEGKWILHTYLPHHNYCSICEKDSPYNKRWNFCPNCGAKMEVTE